MLELSLEEGQGGWVRPFCGGEDGWAFIGRGQSAWFLFLGGGNVWVSSFFRGEGAGGLGPYWREDRMRWFPLLWREAGRPASPFWGG